VWFLWVTHGEREISAVLDRRKPGMEDLHRLPFAGMVVKETLRLYPPIGRVTHARSSHEAQSGY